MFCRILVVITVVIFFPLLVKSQNLNGGLIGHYGFNGDFEDKSGNSNEGFARGGVSFSNDRWGQGNSALTFNGVDGYVELPHSKSMENFSNSISINVWVKTKGKNEDGFVAILSKTNSKKILQAFAFMFRDYNGGWDPYTNETMKTPFPFHTWTMFTFIDDSISRRLYQNQKLILEKKRTKEEQAKFKIRQNYLPILIGAEPYIEWEYYYGEMDDLRIYNRSLSECEIKFLYQEQPFTPKERANNYVAKKLEEWKERGEYEKTIDYNKRLESKVHEKSDAFEQEIIDKIASEVLWSCGSKKYDADNEEFILIFNNVEPFKISVPINEAEEFGENFNSLEFIDPKFSLQNKPNLEVECIIIKNPLNNKVYTYGCSEEDLVKVESKKVLVKLWDDKKQDGDIVSVFINDKLVKSKIKVKNKAVEFKIELEEGLNTFKLLAHNEGDEPPNTAAILIDDEHQQYKHVLSSKKNEYSELKILYFKSK